MDRQENLSHLISYCLQKGYPVTFKPGELNWFKIRGIHYDHTIAPAKYHIHLLVDFVNGIPRVLCWEEHSPWRTKRFKAFLATDTRHLPTSEFKHELVFINGHNLMVLRGE